MLQISFIENNKAEVISGLKKKGFKEIHLVDKALEINERRKRLKFDFDEKQAEQNRISKSIGDLFKAGKQDEAKELRESSVELKGKTQALEEELKHVRQEIEDVLVSIPNLPHANVPEGRTPEDNVEVRTNGKAEPLGENVKPHWDLIQEYGLLDMELGVKITGAGFPVYLGKGAKLQRALISFFLDRAEAAGFNEVIPPYLVNEETAFGTGQLPDKEGQMYEMKQEKYYLIPTAEVPLTNIYRDVILNEDDLPKKVSAHSPCFRREAGSYGKDVRGLNRVHQFDKVEIVQLVHPEKSYDVIEDMVAHVEGLLKDLGLPYRVLALCGGDMSFTSALTYDLEVYSAAQERWLEVSSVSNFETYQSNRMKIRFRGTDKKPKLVHTLNGSALALPRIMAALLENNQSEEGIAIPEVLHKYTGFTSITK